MHNMLGVRFKRVQTIRAGTSAKCPVRRSGLGRPDTKEKVGAQTPSHAFHRGVSPGKWSYKSPMMFDNLITARDCLATLRS
jgi:hypothetical protein